MNILAFLPHPGFASRLASLLSLALVACALMQPGPAHAATSLTAADEKAIRTVIEGQLAAFARDDARKAFSYAASNVREAVGDATGFMAMVRNSYPMVYRPASVAFWKPEGAGLQAIQRVQITDASGGSWLALYSLERQKGKPWRITGCAVVENKARMA